MLPDCLPAEQTNKGYKCWPIEIEKNLTFLGKCRARDHKSLKQCPIEMEKNLTFGKCRASVRKYMLFASWEVRIVKNCDRGLELNHCGKNLRKITLSPFELR